jgi:hypothetical protein
MSIEINQVFEYQFPNLNEIENKRTTIRISSDGLSVFVKDQLNEVKYASAYRLASNNKITTYEEAITQIKLKDHWLSKNRAEIFVIIDDLGYVFVPTVLFDKENASLYLQSQVNSDKINQEEILVSELNDISGVFLVNKELLNASKFLAENSNVISYTQALLEFCRKINQKRKPFSVLISFFDSYFDIIIIKEEKLFYFNRFQYTTKEDFIYFMVMTLQNLEINSANVEISIIGKIEPQSSLNELLHRYFDDVRFVTPEKNFSWDYHRYCVEQNY